MTKPPASSTPPGPRVELIPITDLHPHPRNYRTHPPDQLEHLKQSLLEHGLYRNVVVARDNTLLAGHGVWLAATLLDWTHLEVRRVDLDPDHPRALKLLAADNELSHLAADDDRALTELLREIRDEDADGLMGTGYDDNMLAALVYVTRPEHEINREEDAAAWVGMPDYNALGQHPKLMVQTETEEARTKVLDLLGITHIHGRNGDLWSVWYPPREADDQSSLRYTDTTSEPTA